MIFHYTLIFSLILTLTELWHFSDEGAPTKKQTYKITWNNIDNGLSYGVIPVQSNAKVADKNIYVLKINPDQYQFELVCSTENDTTFRTVDEWCKLKGCVAGFNAGMYSLKKSTIGMGYLRNFDHFNNGEFRSVYKAIAAFNRKTGAVPDFDIFDLEKEKWETIESQYNSFLQSIRMIDGNRNVSPWRTKKKLSCSMIVMATDAQKNVLVLLTRIPYSLNIFARMMLQMPLNIQRAMYLEGGPESSLFVATKDSSIQKFGSWVYPGYAHDKNDQFRKLPNIIGVKKRSSSL